MLESIAGVPVIAALASLAVPAFFVALASIKSSYLRNAAATLSCALVAVVFGAIESMGTWTFPLGLILSVAGDYMLSHRRGREGWYMAGIAFFFLAHALFAMAFWVAGAGMGTVSLVVFIALLTGYGAFYVRVLLPGIGSPLMRTMVLGYLLISVLSLSLSFSVQAILPARALLALGVMLIVFSDTVIALKDFAGRPRLAPLIIPTYLMSHLTMTAGFVLGSAFGN